MLMLPRIGLARTIELTLTARMMEAAECRAIGLINYLVARPEEVMPKTREVAETDGVEARDGHAAQQGSASARSRRRPSTRPSATAGCIQAEAFASGEPQAAMRVFFAERAARRKARDAAQGKG